MFSIDSLREKGKNLDIFLVLVFFVDLFFWLKFLEMRHNQVPISVQPSFVAAANGSIQKHKGRKLAAFLQKREREKLTPIAVVICVCADRKSIGFFTRKNERSFPAPKTRHERVIRSLFQKGTKRELWFCSKWFVFFAGHVFLLLETSSTKHPHSVSTFLQNSFFFGDF